MKQRNIILRAAVTAALATAFGAAHAGSITAPATDGAATKYAAEALTSATAVTTPSVEYTMGVDRSVAQDFTMIFTPSTGATLDPTSCDPANFAVAGAGVATISTKRASTSECAIEVDVTTAFVANTTTITSDLVLATHPLATAGSSVSYTVALKDLGETAFIDNTGSLTRVVATSVNAVNVYAAAADTATIADVNATAGPLLGFVAGGAAPVDTALIAAANLTFDNNSVNAKIADGATNFDFLATTGTTTIALTDANKSFGALATGGLCLDKNDNATLCETGEVFAAAVGSTATLATIPAAAFPAQGAPATRLVSFETDATTSIGTSRTIAVAGTVTPQVGAAHDFADTGTVNGTWWQWSANAIELWSPYFSTASGWISRFSLQNIGTSPVTYSATCLAEDGNVATAGAAASGTLVAGTTVINASDVCTFSGNTRGSVRFVINAPAGNLHGAYNLVNATTGSTSITEMTRPYNAGTF